MLPLPLLLLLLLGTALLLSISAAAVTLIPSCPRGTTSTTTSQSFTIPTPPEALYPHLGDFYSPTWKLLLSDLNLTTAPPNRTFTLNTSLLTETLLSNSSTPRPFAAFSTLYTLAAPFEAAPGLNILAYNASISALLRACGGGPGWSQVVWEVAACVEGEGAAEWVDAWVEALVERVFVSVAVGWREGEVGAEVVERCAGVGYVATATATATATQVVPDRTAVTQVQSMLDDAASGRAQVGGLWVVWVGVVGAGWWWF